MADEFRGQLKSSEQHRTTRGPGGNRYNEKSIISSVNFAKITRPAKHVKNLDITAMLNLLAKCYKKAYYCVFHGYFDIQKSGKNG